MGLDCENKYARRLGGGQIKFEEFPQKKAAGELSKYVARKGLACNALRNIGLRSRDISQGRRRERRSGDDYLRPKEYENGSFN